MRTPEVELVGGPCPFRDHGKIRITGNKKDADKAAAAVKSIPDLENMWEGDARLRIQELVEKPNLKAYISFDGNGIWNSIPIIANLKKIMTAGTLYDGKHPRYVYVGSMLRFLEVDKCILSDYFYSFLNLDCGSIAHYNKQGWVTIYQTVDDLKAFFKKNEFGHPVRENIPGWKTDSKRVVELIEHILFPFESFMKAKKQEEAKAFAGQTEFIHPAVIVSIMFPEKPRFSLAALAKERANAKS